MSAPVSGGGQLRARPSGNGECCSSTYGSSLRPDQAAKVGTSTFCYDATLNLSGTSSGAQFTLSSAQPVTCNAVPSGTSYTGTTLAIQAVTVTGAGCYDVTLSLAASSPRLFAS